MFTVQYDLDYYAWTLYNAQLLREGRLSELDVVHLAEEIESMGASERRELESRLLVLLQHLLKWQFQSEQRSSRWLGTIDEQRMQLEILLRQSPSLKRVCSESIDFSYPKARKKAASETNLALSIFPEFCSYSIADILDETFFPESIK